MSTFLLVCTYIACVEEYTQHGGDFHTHEYRGKYIDQHALLAQPHKPPPLHTLHVATLILPALFNGESKIMSSA